MDYRLARKYLTRSVDCFFNFFYKIVDFGKVLIDVWWAFYDIWANFFGIFINYFSYLYFVFLFVLDKFTLWRSFIFFWRKTASYDPTAAAKAYHDRNAVPVHPMYSGTSTAAKAVKSAAKTVSNATKTVADSAIGVAASAAYSAKSTVEEAGFGSYRAPVGGRVNIFKRTAETIHDFFRAIKDGFKKFFVKIGEAFANKFQPVSEKEDEQNSGLINDYLKEWQRKRNR